MFIQTVHSNHTPVIPLSVWDMGTADDERQGCIRGVYIHTQIYTHGTYMYIQLALSSDSRVLPLLAPTRLLAR